jgi:hypothetical protein
MSETQCFTETLVVVSCGKCGIAFGLAEDFQRARRKDHETFYCPNGHPRAYLGESAQERELRETKANEAWYREYGERKAKEAETAKRQAAAARGVVTRIKKRVAKGVCPCCKRYFADLHRHMGGQHPEWSASDAS